MISCRVQHFLWYKTIGLHTYVCQESQGTPLEQMSLLINPSMKTCHFMTSEEFNGTSCLRATCQLVIIKIHHFWLSNPHSNFFWFCHILVPFQTSIALGRYVLVGLDADSLFSVLLHLITITTGTTSTDITSEVCLYWLIVVSLRVPENAKYEH